MDVIITGMLLNSREIQYNTFWNSERTLRIPGELRLILWNWDLRNLGNSVLQKIPVDKN